MIIYLHLCTHFLYFDFVHKYNTQDLRTDSTYSRGARPCAPTNGGLTENLRKS